MDRDTTAFRERFNAYKNGKSVSEIYDAGLPRYAGGKANIVDLLDQDLLDTLHYIHNYFSNRGMSTEDIAGIAANIFKESSFRHNAKDGAGYHGYVQMSPDMLLAVANEYGNLDPDTQLQFIFDLITGNSRVKGYTNGLGYKYGQYKTGGDAAEAFRSTFERNKAGRQQSRIDYGNQFYDYFSNIALQKAVGELPAPIVERPDAVAVRKVIPKAKTKARWTGAENVSPYLTGKPILKTRKEIKVPTAVEVNRLQLWKPKFADGKLPRYKDGELPEKSSSSEDAYSRILTLLNPISSIRSRLYNNVFPFAYDDVANRTFSAIFKNKPSDNELIYRMFYNGDKERLDDLWATYLQIPENQRHFSRVLKLSKYKPTISKTKDATYYDVPLNKSELNEIVNHALYFGGLKDSPKLLHPDFGNYTVSRGYDNAGDYASYWDTWDLNPFRGITKISNETINKIVGKLGLNKIEDLSMGIGKPFDIYGRIYFDDYYGLKGKDRGGHYLPEITVYGRKHKSTEDEDEENGSSTYFSNNNLPGYKNGKIHIKPANRGKFTALKKRTGHSASWFKAHGTPAQKKMAVFALNAKKWKH